MYTYVCVTGAVQDQQGEERGQRVGQDYIYMYVYIYYVYICVYAMCMSVSVYIILQERSKTNKEKNAANVWDKTVMSMGYDEYFAAVDKNMVLLPNGKYALLSTEDYTRRRKAGQIKVGAVDRLLVDLDAPAAEPSP